jgi:hypothetical protein
MKTPTFKSLSSKTAKTCFAIAILTLAGVTACKKDSSTSSTPTVTEADAVQMTSDAVTTSTGGMTAQTTTSTTLYAAEAPVITCGATKDTTIAATYTGSGYSYSYTLSWNYALNCASQAFILNYTGSSNYSGLLTTTNGSCIGTDTLTGIGPTSANYALTGSFERKGTSTSKVGQQKSFTSDLKISTTNALVSKSTDEITSGTATVTLTGATSGGKTFSFGGTLTFLGNKTGKLVMNSGNSYNISWE